MDPEAIRESKRRYYRERYKDRAFRAAEAERKSAWLARPEVKLEQSERKERWIQTPEGQKSRQLAVFRYRLRKRFNATKSRYIFDPKEPLDPEKFNELTAFLRERRVPYQVERTDGFLIVRLTLRPESPAKRSRVKPSARQRVCS